MTPKNLLAFSQLPFLQLELALPIYNTRNQPSILLPTSAATMTAKTYTHFLVSTPLPFVTQVEINRPSKLNAFHESMWLELKTIFDSLSFSPDVRAIILSGAGEKAFTTG